VEPLEDRWLPSTFTVINTADTGTGSLRQAITDANANPGADTIAFNIPGSGQRLIQIMTVLPMITDPVFIDGNTQPGFTKTPLVVLEDGTTMRTLLVGLDIRAGNSTVRGLGIQAFRNGTGLRFETGGNNLVEGCDLGVTAPQSDQLQLDSDGVDIINAANNTVGGTTAAARNIISGSLNDGVFINGAGSTGNVVEGNYIGTDPTGTKTLGNINGVIIEAAAGNRVGGTSARARNVISSNQRVDIELEDAGTSGNVVEGNRIGTNAKGTAALGTSSAGVEFGAARGAVSGNTLGGTTAGARNLISGCTIGVSFDAAAASGNLVEGNYIGTDVTGANSIPNGRGVTFGVFFAGPSNNTIGGSAAGAGNRIAFNTGDGVFVNSGTGNRISENSIYSNGGRGIDLNTSNNANNKLAAPTLTSAVNASGTSTTVQGSISGAPNTTYTLEFFSNVTADPSGFGQGQTFLSSVTVTTDSTGSGKFTVTLGPVTVGEFITATTTDPLNDTSQFSNDQQVQS
jgi:hypothetical protein